MKKSVQDFLTRHMISPSCFDIDKITKGIIDEMDRGLNGQKSSLPMIDSFCSDSFKLKSNTNVIVIDAGGTNLRTCLVHFDENLEPVIEDFRKTSMPGTNGEVSAKQFFGKLADECERFITKADRIGFCFSYEAKIMPDHDGYPVLMSKEVKAPEIIGKHLGKELLAELSSRGYDVKNKKVIILNDTVTTLLAGLCKTEKVNCEGCIGFILGTGTNTAYPENGTIINVESGGYDYAPGDIDKTFIAKTELPDYHHFEKLISGAYLGPLALEILKCAKNEGVVDIDLPQSLGTKAMSDGIDEKTFDSDVIDILETFIERTALFTAANLSAAVIKSGYGKNKPVLINADGTTFYKTGNLGKQAMAYTKDYLASKGLKAEFILIENSPTIGSAIGALSL